MRTQNGNLTGAAAAAQRRDFLDSLIPDQLTPHDHLRIKVETFETILRVTDGSFVEFRSKISADLEAARAEIKELEEQEALAHIDSLVGAERLTINEMNDAAELFTPRTYNNKHVPDGVCPLCGEVLIVKERRRYIRKTGEYDITPFVACSMWDRTGCRHKQEFTPEIKATIDNAVSMVDLDMGI